jgi:RimJ/RimL family protein N-acetyltransferase
MGYILETERCRLREMREEDGPILYRLNSDPEVIRYTGDPPFESEAAAIEFIRNYEAYKKYGMGRWLAERKEDGEILGWCGLKYLPGENQVDLGYRFFRKYWGFNNYIVHKST